MQTRDLAGVQQGVAAFAALRCHERRLKTSVRLGQQTVGGKIEHAILIQSTFKSTAVLDPVVGKVCPDDNTVRRADRSGHELNLGRSFRQLR